MENLVVLTLDVKSSKSLSLAIKGETERREKALTEEGAKAAHCRAAATRKRDIPR